MRWECFGDFPWDGPLLWLIRNYCNTLPLSLVKQDVYVNLYCLWEIWWLIEWRDWPILVVVIVPSWQIWMSTADQCNTHSIGELSVTSKNPQTGVFSGQSEPVISCCFCQTHAVEVEECWLQWWATSARGCHWWLLHNRRITILSVVLCWNYELAQLFPLQHDVVWCSMM